MGEKSFELRPYQREGIDRLRNELRLMGKPKRALLVAPCGAGKTACAAELIRLCVEKGGRALFLARGRELVHQCESALGRVGVEYGVMMAGRGYWKGANVVVASKDTFHSWVVRRGIHQLPPFDLVIPDEAHLSVSKTWLQILEKYRGSVIVGLTATPARGNGRGLGGAYGAMTVIAQTSELIAGGFIVPMRVFAPYRPNLKGLKRDKNGDFDREDAAKRMDKPQLVGDVVQHWLDLGRGRPTVVFACTVAHALHLREDFQAKGVKVDHVDGTTDRDVRDAIIDRMNAGELEVITNVGVLQQGVDIPRVSCCVLARPTRSLVLYQQATGRAKRPFPGKEDALLIDHSGSCYIHGLPDEDIEWSLDEDEKVEERMARKKPPGEKEPIHCPKCHALFARGPVCTNCGHKVQRKSKAKEVKAGKLVEVTEGPDASPEDKERYWRYCLAVMAAKGRTAAAAGMMYKARFRHWPGEGGEGLKNLPQGGKWKMPVAVLFPQFVREKA